MKNKLFIAFLLFIPCVAHPMERAEQYDDISSKPWAWFITHLAVNGDIKGLGYSISDFDPAVRIFDEDTKQLILSLQRITLEGKNTDNPSKNVSIQVYNINKDGQKIGEKLIVQDKGKKILSLDIGAGYQLYSYDPNGNKDLKITSSSPAGSIKSTIPLIRLTPSKVLFPGKPEKIKEFFADLQKEYAEKKGNH